MVKHLLLTSYSQLHFSSFPLGKFSMKWQVLQWNMKVAKLGSLLGVPLEAFTEDASHCHTSCTASTWQNMFISHRFITRLYLLQYLELLQFLCQVLAGFEIIHLPPSIQDKACHTTHLLPKQSCIFNLKLVHYGVSKFISPWVHSAEMSALSLNTVSIQ